MYLIGPKNHRIMLVCKRIFSLDSEWTKNHFAYALQHNSVLVCLILVHVYLGNTGNLRYVA